jgi:anaerobic magnesium-protoporphyrin IX monomethyl ester cyclase
MSLQQTIDAGIENNSPNAAPRGHERRSFVQPLNEMTVAEALRRFAARNAEVVKILRPPAIYSARSYSTPLAVPLGPAYLAATLEAAGYTTEVIDGIGEGIFSIRTIAGGKLKYQGLTVEELIERVGPETKILGISFMFSQGWNHYRQIVQAIKRAYPKLIIVAGGEHPTAMAEFLMRDCPEIDYIIMGEGEVALLELVWRLCGGNPKLVYAASF